MAVSHIFNGKVHKLPGVYAVTKSLIQAPNITASYSKVLVIDTGAKNEVFARGAGVDGTYAKGKNAIYHLRSASEMKSFIKGGYWSVLADALFNPSNIRDTSGVSDVYFISACNTTPAKCTLNVGGIVFEVACKDEGTFGNSYGTMSDNTFGEVPITVPATLTMKTLKRGYGVKLDIGERDRDKFVLKFYVGTYNGLYDDGMPYDQFMDDARESLVLSSPEFSDVGEIYDWMKTDPDFDDGFVLVNDQTRPQGSLVPIYNNSGTVIQSPDIVPDIPDGFVPFKGGTQSYRQEHIDQVIESTKGMDTSFVITDRYGVNEGRGDINRQIEFAVLNQRFEQFLVVGGGKTKDEFNKRRATGLSSVQMARDYNSDYVWVIHGGIKKVGRGGKLREWDSLYHACYILGRIAGMPPQVPPTFKEIDISGLSHDLTEIEKIEALDSGVLTTYFDEDFQRFTILKGVNTLQANNQLVNPDGTSCSIQVRRCAAIINKEMIQDAKRELFSQRDGVTIMSLPPEQLETWTTAKLLNKIERQLLVEFSDINIERRQDAYFVSYSFRPNYEINMLFFSSFIID